MKKQIKGTKMTKISLKKKKARTNHKSEVTKFPAPSLYATLDISFSNPETVSSLSLNTLPTVTDLVNATSNVEEFDQFQLVLRRF